MNIVFDPRFLGKSYTPAQTTPEALFRLKVMEKYSQLRKQGLNEKETLEILEVKRSTFYRWKKKYRPWDKKSAGLSNKSRRPKRFRASIKITHLLIQQTLSIRQEFPMYGKAKIKILLQREGIKVSESTIGRILKELIERKKIDPIPFLRGKTAKRRKLNRKHAQRFKFKRAKTIGELIQIDHMSINTNTGTTTIKEFRAICPISRITVSKQYKRATAKNAKDFLKYLETKLPFKIKSIQTDGGSEFMKDFEQYCETENIELFILPPRSPKLNGCIERANQTYRYEFWNLYEMPYTMIDLRTMFEAFEHHYNFERPHASLDYLTPMEYYAKLQQKAA